METPDFASSQNGRLAAKMTLSQTQTSEGEKRLITTYEIERTTAIVGMLKLDRISLKPRARELDANEQPHRFTALRTDAEESERHVKRSHL